MERGDRTVAEPCRKQLDKVEARHLFAEVDEVLCRRDTAAEALDPRAQDREEVFVANRGAAESGSAEPPQPPTKTPTTSAVTENASDAVREHMLISLSLVWGRVPIDRVASKLPTPIVTFSGLSTGAT